MVHRTLTLISVVSCLLVVASFTLFAHDQMAGASRHQENELVGTAPAPPGGPSPKSAHASRVRRFIDGAASKLTSPFASLVHSDNAWVQHGLSTVIALVIYGLGLGTLSRFAQGGAKLPAAQLE